VAVFDATNTTKERRHSVFERCRAHSRFINVIFIEVFFPILFILSIKLRYFLKTKDYLLICYLRRNIEHL
jgi:hypothetical protein